MDELIFHRYTIPKRKLCFRYL